MRSMAGLWIVAISLVASVAADANPYLAKPGEATVSLRVATCAASGGFVHLYSALDHGLFDKYGIKFSHIYIRGSSLSLAALSSDEVQFLYCAADPTLPGMVTGIDAKLVAAPLVGLPYVLIARKDIKRPEDLKGKSIGFTRPGSLSHRLSRAILKKFNLTEEEVRLRPLGGSQPEQYQALVQDIVQATPITPPMDVRGKRDGFPVVYHFSDLNLPFIYSALHTNSKTLKEHPGIVQNAVAALAEALYFVEKNPEKAKSSISKVMKVNDPEALHSAYDAYARWIINRRMIVPGDAVADSVQIAREAGTNIRKKPAELFDNSFAENLEKSGFLREIWSGELPEGKKKP